MINTVVKNIYNKHQLKILSTLDDNEDQNYEENERSVKPMGCI